jgi:cytochrome c peroxidase
MRTTHLAAVITLFATACSSTSPPETTRLASRSTLADHTATCQADPRVQLGLVTQEVCEGAELFFRESFDGNGRTCASCHPADNNFTIDPTSIAALPASDPLFIAEQEPALATLERPALMRQFGLILENVDGLSDLTNRFTMRSVPHTFSLSTSVTAGIGDGSTIPPNERTGWSGDGAPGAGELRDFQTGAIIQHYPRTLARSAGSDFRLATSDELDRIVAYMRTVGRSNELALGAVTFGDPGAEAGRQLFLAPASRCNFCHRNAGANNPSGANFNFNTGVETVRLAALDLSGIPRDAGFGQAPFDANGDGSLDSFGNGTFNTPPLVEAADTGPFFHTNGSATIEDAVAFYTTAAFASSPAGGGTAVALTAAQIGDLGRFLRAINAAFNCQLALRRLDAARALVDALGLASPAVQTTMLALAKAEVDDAEVVLAAAGGGFYNNERSRLQTASNFIDQAIGAHQVDTRRSKIDDARDRVNLANAGIGQGLGFSIGEGTLMF